MRQQIMSKLEQEVMNVVWNFKQCTVRDVLGKLKGKKLAYTTVSTILTRLYEKEMLEKLGKDFAIVYKPKLQKKEYGKKLTSLFMKTFFTNFGNVAASSFAESIEELPKDKKEYLLKLLKDYDKT
ncbi:MAG: BlaI/MecI/CopY family transcriptional regulator [bacterium]|nr:BlaI/MecI/CopY family transcriptional regulator [bacterium]